MPTYTFQEVRRTKTVKFKCGCGKRFQRKVAATQTINPFNRTANGTPKTFGDIWPELAAKLETMRARDNCPGCDQPAPVVGEHIEGYAGR